MLRVCLVFYVVTYAASELFTAAQIDPWLRGLYPLMRFIPVLVPLAMFVSTSSLVTLDLASTESRYPGHFLTLPLNSRQLVLPFMMGALLLAALLWAAGFAVSDGRLLTGPRPALPQPQAGESVVNSIPLLLASGLAWIQALVWTSFRRRRTRVWALLAMIMAHFTLLVFLAAHAIAALTGVVLCVLSLGIAYSVATWGIGRARCGDPILHDERPAKPQPRQRSRTTSGQPFASPRAAQAWFEWRTHGARNRSPFVLLVPLVFAITLAMALVNQWNHWQSPLEPPALFAMVSSATLTCFGALLLVAYLTGPIAASFRSSVTWSRNDEFAMPSFFAALPLSTGDFAWAKLRTAALGTLIFVVLVALFFIPTTLILGQGRLWVALFEVLRDQYGLFEAVLRVTLVPLGLAVFVMASGANLVWTALFGRGWKLVSIGVTVLSGALLMWTTVLRAHPEWQPWMAATLRALVPWLAIIKVGGLAWFVRRVALREHYSVSRIASIISVWTIAVLVSWGFGLRVMPDASASILFCTVVVAMPVLGILAAPLALQINRTR